MTSGAALKPNNIATQISAVPVCSPGLMQFFSLDGMHAKMGKRILQIDQAKFHLIAFVAPFKFMFTCSHDSKARHDVLGPG